MKVYLSQPKIRKFTSGLLAVWLSGFVFLFCCGTMPFKAAETDFCPLVKYGGHCDKSKKSGDAPTFSGESGTQFDCCEFIPKVFSKFRTLENAQKSVQPADKLKIERPQFFAVQSYFDPVRTFHQPVFPQEKIHIKNCVFRI